MSLLPGLPEVSVLDPLQTENVPHQGEWAMLSNAVNMSPIMEFGPTNNTYHHTAHNSGFVTLEQSGRSMPYTYVIN